MSKVGIVAGSFDPVTNGHVWLMKEALALVEQLIVVVGVNAAKKYHFSAEERKSLVERVLKDALSTKDFERTKVVILENDLLINFASEVKATHIIRGLRNTADFNIEYQMVMFNRKINPDVHTAFVMTPPKLVEVSSSTVKGLVGLKNWQSHVERYCHSAVVRALQAKLESAAEAKAP